MVGRATPLPCSYLQHCVLPGLFPIGITKGCSPPCMTIPGLAQHGSHSPGAANLVKLRKIITQGRPALATATALAGLARGCMYPVPDQDRDSPEDSMLLSSALASTRPDEELPQKDIQYPEPQVPNRKATLSGCRWWPTINS